MTLMVSNVHDYQDEIHGRCFDITVPGWPHWHSGDGVLHSAALRLDIVDVPSITREEDRRKDEDELGSTGKSSSGHVNVAL